MFNTDKLSMPLEYVEGKINKISIRIKKSNYILTE